MIVLLIFLFVYSSICAEPTWSNYAPNIMYSGEYKAFLTTKSTGLLATVNQTMYRSDVTAANYFTSAPRVMLSMMGYRQEAPPDSNTFTGFDVKLSTITTTNFLVIHNIYGASMAYLDYMYLAVSQTNTDFFLGEYTQTFDQTVLNKSYSLDIAVNGNESYPNYPTNTIEMKGFLAGYSLKQGTASGFELNFTLTVTNASFFAIQVSTNVNSVLQKINYYRIGYDRTAIERRTNRDVFRDFYFELVNNVNVISIYNSSWGSLTEFQYRNFLMGTNKISITGTAPMAVEFFLYYYFAVSMAKVDAVYYLANPAIAKYLYGETFYHAIPDCTPAAPNIYYQPSDRKCYSSCQTLGYFTDTGTNTCIACHFTCRTCSAGYLANKCLSCDTNYRVFDSSTSACICPVQTYDDLTNLACPSCHSSCLTCVSSASNGCKSCNSTLNREFSDPNNDGIGQCICKSKYSENSTNQCQSCSVGCLACSFSGSTQLCSSCDANQHMTLSNNNCVCQTNFYLIQNVCTAEKCGDGILTPSQECDDDNIINKDGCSSSCKIQPEHVCIQNSSISPYSVCYYNGTIQMTITDVQKSLSSNQVSLTIQIDTSSSINQDYLKNYLTSSPSIVIEDAPARLLTQKQRILVSSNTVITYVNYDQVNKILQVTFSYNATFDITKKKIRFQPSLSSATQQVKYFYNSPEAIINLEKTYNKVDTTYYDSSVYQSAGALRSAFLVLLILFWVMSLIMIVIVIGKGNVAMEMMIVYQIAYVSLLTQDKLEISFAGLLEFGKYTAGYNVDFLISQQNCVNFAAINLSCNLFNNLNISFFLMILIAVIFWCLKLVNKLLNVRAERLFVENKNKKYMEENNQRTDENIVPNIGFVERVSQSHIRSFESQSVRKIQENYYKDQQYISKRIYNFLLDIQFFLSFVTVIIWAMSISFIKQSSIQGIVEAICIPVVYFSVWVFWFLKYFKEDFDFSFVKAHKRSENIYDDEQNQSVQGGNQQRPERNEQSQPKKRRFSASFLKLLIYPIFWLGLLGIGVVLALSQPVGYVSESIIIAGSGVFLFLNILIEMHQQKLHMIRSIVNCILLALIQGAYILSQSNSIVGSGLPIAATVFALLSLVFVSNSIATLYLYRLQVILLRKKQESKEVEKIQMQITKLETLKRQKQIENAGIFLKINDFKSSQSSQSQIQQTVKKEPQYNFNSNYDQSPTKTTYQRPTMMRQEIPYMLNQIKIGLSEPYVNVYNKQLNSFNQRSGSDTLIKTAQKKLSSIKYLQDLTSTKFQQSKNIRTFPNNTNKTISNQ